MRAEEVIEAFGKIDRIVHGGVGDVYQIVHIGQFQENGNWVPCAVYKPVASRDSHMTFVRKLDDFAKFRVCN